MCVFQQCVSPAVLVGVDQTHDVGFSVFLFFRIQAAISVQVERIGKILSLKAEQVSVYS